MRRIHHRLRRRELPAFQHQRFERQLSLCLNYRNVSTRDAPAVPTTSWFYVFGPRFRAP